MSRQSRPRSAGGGSTAAMFWEAMQQAASWLARMRQDITKPPGHLAGGLDALADKKTLDNVSWQDNGLAAMAQEILDGAVSDLLDPAARMQDFDGGVKGLFSGHEGFLSIGARSP